MAKYFSEKEIVGLKDDLVYKLDIFRGALGMPVRLTETVASGGSHVENTAHATGLASDCTIRHPSDRRPYSLEEQFLLVWAAGIAGFNRVGIYDRHVHLDIDKTKPKAIWTGKSK
jgi:hypothetical protein